MQRDLRLTPVVAVSLACLLAGVAAARQQAPQASVSISGTVRAAQGVTLPPLAAVVFPADPARQTGPASAQAVRREAIADGRFVIRGLPPGEYRLAFVPESMLNDWPSREAIDRVIARRPMPLPSALEGDLAIDAVLKLDGDIVVVQDAKMSMSRIETVAPSGARRGLPPGIASPRATGPAPPAAPGSISGRVTGVNGEPIAGIDVYSVRRITRSGQPTLVAFGDGTATDEDGRYRLANRVAAEYFVVALPFGRGPGAGRKSPPAVRGADGVTRGYVGTFYGDSLNDVKAVPVAVAMAERAGIDIRLMYVPVYEVRGSTPAGGGPLGAMVVLNPAETLGGLASRWTAVSADGSFVIQDVHDGEYRLSFSGAAGPAGWSEGRVIVSGRSPEPVALTPRPPTVVSGRIEFAGQTPAPTGIAGNPQFTVDLRPAVMVPGTTLGRGSIGADGSFTVTGAGAGPFVLRAAAPFPWVQIEGSVNGVDTLDVPAPASLQAGEGRVVFADRTSAILVNVTDAQDAPADATVLVFADDPRYWEQRSRRVQLAPTGASGSCTIQNLPPGRYLIVASRSFRSTQAVSPAFLEPLKPRAIPFEITSGQNRSLRIRVDR